MDLPTISLGFVKTPKFSSFDRIDQVDKFSEKSSHNFSTLRDKNRKFETQNVKNQRIFSCSTLFILPEEQNRSKAFKNVHNRQY